MNLSSCYCEMNPNQGIALLGNRPCKTLSTTSLPNLLSVENSLAQYSWAASQHPTACLPPAEASRLWAVPAPWLCLYLEAAPLSDTPTELSRCLSGSLHPWNPPDSPEILYFFVTFWFCTVVLYIFILSLLTVKLAPWRQLVSCLSFKTW